MVRQSREKRNDYYVEIFEEEDLKEFVLPSEVDRRRARNGGGVSGGSSRGGSERKRSRGLGGGKGKWVVILGIVFLLYLFYDVLLSYLMMVLKMNPTIYSYYLGVEKEIVNNTVLGLFYVAVFGSLFFLALPSEALFVYFLDSTAYPFFVIILAMVLGNVAGLCFNYFFGWVLGERFASKIFSKSFEKYKDKIDRFGGYILLFGNIFPGPVEVLAVFYGSFKFDFGRYVYLCFVGRLVKYLVLFVLFSFYWDSISMFYSDLLLEFANLKAIYAAVIG